MATIAEQLTSLANTKTAIKNAIVAKGVTVADDTPFSAYATKISEISGGAPVTKLGLSIDDFIGEVKDGTVFKPDVIPIIDLSGVETVDTLAFDSLFAYKKGWMKNVNKIKNVGSSSFTQMFIGAPSFVIEQPISFDSLESITEGSAFANFVDLSECALNIAQNICFPALKVIGGQDEFKRAFKPPFTMTLPVGFVDGLFPVLERIEGYNVFDNFVYYGNNPTFTFSKVKTMAGSEYFSSDALFGMFYNAGTVWKFPRATELSGYVWSVGSSYTGELHFAAANQEAIEACNGYDKKWGFVGATVYFDLMLNITVNSIVYSRNRIINSYTSWEDELGNLIYTDATTEPAVGTIVYSDQGTTQIGTVEAVA